MWNKHKGAPHPEAIHKPVGFLPGDATPTGRHPALIEEKGEEEIVGNIIQGSNRFLISTEFRFIYCQKV